MYISLFSRLRGPRNNDIQVANTQSTPIVYSNTNKMNQDPLEKWLTLGLGQTIYNVRLEHLRAPKSKKELKLIFYKSCKDGSMSKGNGAR